MNKTNIKHYLLSRFKKARFSLFTLYKIMIPFSLASYALAKLGWLPYLGALCEPLVGFLDLPPEAGLIWASCMAVNMYAGLAIAPVLLAGVELTVTQATVLGSIILIAHSLPVEVSIAKKATVPVWQTLTLRIFGALIYGKILSLTIPLLFTESISSLRLPAGTSPHEIPFTDWFFEQLLMYGAMALIITGLIFLLDILKALHIERLFLIILHPLLKQIGISNKGSSMLLIGLFLGISYGGSLIIEQVQSGECEPNDAYLSMNFLSLCHSVIEDTILMMLLGGALFGLLYGRVVFAFIAIAILNSFISNAKKKLITTSH